MSNERKSVILDALAGIGVITFLGMTVYEIVKMFRGSNRAIEKIDAEIEEMEQATRDLRSKTEELRNKTAELRRLRDEIEAMPDPDEDVTYHSDSRPLIAKAGGAHRAYNGR